VSFLAKLQKIPVLGWLIGAIILLLLLLLLAFEKLRIAQARLRIESRLRVAQRDRERAIKDILAGQKRRGLELQEEAAKREKHWDMERSILTAKSKNLLGVSDAVNKAFSRRP